MSLSSRFRVLRMRNERPVSQPLYALAAASILAIALFTARPVFAAVGLVYDVVIIRTGEGAEPGAQVVVRVWTAATNLKTDLLESRGKAQISKISFLSTDAGLTIVLVDPIKKAYSKIDLSSFDANTAATKGLSVAPVPKPEEKLTKVIDEPGGHLLGFPVHHYQFRREFSRPEKSNPERRTTAEMLDDVWITTALAGNQAFVGPRDQSILLLFISQFAPLNLPDGTVIRGFQLKRKSVLTFATPDGRRHTMQVQMEVKQVNRKNLADSTFAIPGDFKEVDLRALTLPGLSRELK